MYDYPYILTVCKDISTNISLRPLDGPWLDAVQCLSIGLKSDISLADNDIVMWKT